MYGFTEDKGKWNLGNWSGFAVSREAFKIGALSSIQRVVNAFPDKYVAEIPVSSLSTVIQSILGENRTPMALMTEMCGSIYSQGAIVPLSDEEKKGFEVVEGIYTQNEILYVVAKRKPFKDLVFVIKGA